jgi:UDP-N-acetylglucosamine/UDP-N-acetylgalactosamine diphosphorylase
MDIPQTISERLEKHRQVHLLQFWAELTDEQRQQLLSDIEQVDFDLLERLWKPSNDSQGSADAKRVDRARSPENLVRLQHSAEADADRRQAAQVGRQLLSEGRVGAILVAGGQGTRLGFDKPKGMFPIGPLSQKSLYQWFAEQLLSRSRESGATIPYFIMTSDATHADTVAFFKEHRFFGLPPEDVYFFQQGLLPAVAGDAPRLLLDEKHRLSQSPDGHGGILKALHRHGLLDEMAACGIDVLYYHQVDNPTAVFCDPAFLGWHAQQGSEVSTKVVAKVSPDERMGVVCSVDGRTEIIEYSDLTPEQSRITNSDGTLRFWAGNTAIHAFDRGFLSRLANEGVDLPYHIAKKAVPFIDENGQRVTPASPNARKFEQFIFDALPLAARALVVEADRGVEFNPVKNREGSDSPATSRAAILANHRRWIEAAGGRIEEAARVEVSPLFAADEEQARPLIEPDAVFSSDTVLEHPRSGDVLNTESPRKD